MTTTLTAKSGQVRVSQIDIEIITPSPENEKLYGPVDPADPAIKAMARSIRRNGILTPLHITEDGYLEDGHRRHTAAKLAGLKTVPCVVVPVTREGNIDGHVRRLREYNRQRAKTNDMHLREAIIDMRPELAHQELIRMRESRSAVMVDTMDLGAVRSRAKIERLKMPMLEAAITAINSRRKFWPMSLRTVHYLLLNDPPLRRATNPKSTYTNDSKGICYGDLSDLLTRARVQGLIPFDAISDETRPSTTWPVCSDVSAYFTDQVGGMFGGYYRNLQVSQPNHIEIVAEKLTLAPIVRPIAGDFCLPVTIMKGKSSLSARYEIVKRFRKSGKEKLILLILSDADPDGDVIAESVARWIRDDFDIQNIEAIKVGLTVAQAKQLGLTSNAEAKSGSATYHAWVKQNGSTVYELEALDAYGPEKLQDMLREAIHGVLDWELFNKEQVQEQEDAAFLSTARRRVREALIDMEGT